MAIRSGVGVSHNRNPREAAREAARAAMDRAGVERPDFVLLFASVGHPQQVVIDEVRAVTGAPVSGCSAEGVIASGVADESNFSIAVMALGSDQLRFTHGIAKGLKQDPASVGRRIGETLAAELPPDPIALLIFPDGMTVNFAALVSNIEAALPPGTSLPMLGGTASDNLKFERTYQYCDDQVVSDGVAWVLLSGPSRAAWAVNHGCIPVGVEHIVTKSVGNVIFEIDHRRAVDVLGDYISEDEMGDWMKVVMTLSLGLKAPAAIASEYDQYVIRTLVGGLDHEVGSVTVADAVTTGSSVWVARRDYEKLRAGVDRACDEMLAKLDGKPPELVLHFDCAGRGKSFLREPQKLELLEHLRTRIGDVPWMGFYCYGEISPVSGHNTFHNLTLVLTALY